MRKYILLVITGMLLSSGFNLNAQVINEPPLDGLYENMGVIDKKPAPFSPLRRADVMWQKRIWRVIDFREKMNQAFYYPIKPQASWKSFIQIILDALKEGVITAYDISATDEFLVPLTYSEVISRQSDSIHRVLQRPYPPYDQYDTIIYSEFDPTRVMQLRIKEDWYFDKHRSQMMVRIIGLCPVMIKDRDGEEIPEPLFWIYFPEVRPVLAKSQMFNRFNDAERRTYDDVFWKRLFSSYIYKESNVYDRRISEYVTGIDALFEAERIKNEMFNFEQSLWEY
jgi:gliding motility associated protien GldN